MGGIASSLGRADVLLGGRRSRLRLLHSRLRGGNLAARGRRLNRDISLGRLRRRARIGQIAFCPLQGYLVIAGVDLYENRSGLHILVVFCIHGRDVSADPRADWIDVPVDPRVVRGFAFRFVLPEQVPDDRQQQHRSENPPLGQWMPSKERQPPRPA